jgi:alkylation response protein AidB-like acyl-CoA dehydrogenase
VEIETRYHPNPEQLALGSTIEESLVELLPLSRLHTSCHEAAATWQSLEEIGVFGIGVSETCGGSGLGAVEEALIVMSLGRRLAAPAVLATIGTASLRGTVSSAGERAAVAYRHDGRIILVEEPETSFVLLRDSSGAALHDLRACRTKLLEGRLWLTRLCEMSEPGEPLERFNPSQLTRLRLHDAAALAGIADTALEASVAYARMREQFGRPIGTFQAIKHHCANMVIAARCARDQTGFAAVALDEERSDAAMEVEYAFAVAGSAALENAKLSIQIHGGMGFSDEADPHLFLKRAQLLIAIAGGLEAATGRIASKRGGD